MTAPTEHNQDQLQDHLADRLREAGLRPTRQRIALTDLIFGGGDRHFSAEELHAEARARNIDVSLATVYNTLHQFTEANFVRVLSVEGAKTYFDTNTSDHHHYFIEDENRVVDIVGDPIRLASELKIPDDMELVHVDVVVRLRKKKR